ncbi:mechanosensitive ion channel family protein [Microbacterium sp. YY-01]|uniref:mechanosensitive ion channel family protein n=1 Tax=Microbacterium sp. YY-01 TaxID=3421634 RepID=UPI003D1632C6
MAVSVNSEFLITTAIIIAVAAVIGVGVVYGIRLIGLLISRRVSWVGELGRRVHRSLLVFTLIIAVWLGAAVAPTGVMGLWPIVSRLFLIATIIAGSWLLAAVVSFGFERLMAKEKELLSGAEQRRRQTQLLVIHRLTLVVIAVIAIGGALSTFPQLRALGTSILASAGIVGVVAGLAAQSILGNLIAGIQIVFTDAIRVDDIVVIEGEWGRIGEINLSYVVVYIWDERRLVLPCSYFTTTPIETWTRHSDKIMGAVIMDLDWRVPMDEVRAKFHEIIDASPEWDRRSSSVWVIGSEGGWVTVRFVISAKNSDDQWVLRCQVREKMMTWLQQQHPEALPHTRVRVDDPTSAAEPARNVQSVST